MKTNRGRISFAMLLIVVGAWYLAIEIFPGLKNMAYGSGTWPLQIIGLGLTFCSCSDPFMDTGILHSGQHHHRDRRFIVLAELHR